MNYRTAPEATSRTIVYHPSPRRLLLACIVFVGVIALPGLGIELMRPWSWNTLFAFTFVGLFILSLVSLYLGRVTLVLNERTRLVILTHRRWPLSRRTREFEVDAVASVTTERSRRGRTLRVVLELRDGERVPLTASFYAETGQHQKVIEEIRGWQDVSPHVHDGQ